MTAKPETVPEISEKELYYTSYARLRMAIDTALEQYQNSDMPQGANWQPQAFCTPDNRQNVPEELWFPVPRQGRPAKGMPQLTQLWVSVEDHENLAKRACGGCAVLAQCRDASLRNREEWGIFAGLTADERSAILPRRPGRKKAS